MLIIILIEVQTLIQHQLAYSLRQEKISIPIDVSVGKFSRNFDITAYHTRRSRCKDIENNGEVGQWKWIIDESGIVRGKMEEKP